MSLSQLDNLYRQMILEHAKRPHHHGKLATADKQIELHNPTCGDVLELEVKLDKEKRIEAIAFSGTGCTISQASASLMTDEVLGKTPTEVAEMVEAFSEMITQKTTKDYEALLGDAVILEGVAQFPTRIKCATLAWKAIYQAVVEKGAKKDE